MTEPTSNTRLFDDALDAEFLKRMARIGLRQRGRMIPDFRGRRRALGVGHGLDFADHRPYQRGDDLRRVDWKAYARSGRMLLRRFEPQGRARIAILVDCSASMAVDNGSKLRLAKRLAATLTYGALQQGDHVTLWALHEAAVTPSRSFHVPAQRNGALDFLRELRAEGGTGLAAAALAFASQQESTSIAVLISDLIDRKGIGPAIQRLRAVSQQCHVLHLHTPSDIANIALGAVELIDSESGARLHGTITSEVATRYRQAYEREQQHMARHFARRGVPYVRLSTDQPIEHAVVSMRRAHMVEA